MSVVTVHEWCRSAGLRERARREQGRWSRASGSVAIVMQRIRGWHDEGREYPGVNEDKAHSSRTPRVWLLLGHKAGDNNQVLALAEALAWPWEEKRIVYRPWELLSNRLLGVTLRGIDRGASSALEPPWPDLVISSGRRNEPVARWIRRQAPGVRLVHVGRPWAPLDAFDLIVTTPQYSLPERANVLENELPMHRLRRERLQAEAQRWQPRLAALAAPRIAVLLGGNSGAYVFTPEKARRLGRLVNGLARSQHGSVLVTDSARTPAGVTDAFLARDRRRRALSSLGRTARGQSLPRLSRPRGPVRGHGRQHVDDRRGAVCREAAVPVQPRRRSGLVEAALQLPLQRPGAPAGDGDRAASHASRHRTDNRAPHGAGARLLAGRRRADNDARGVRSTRRAARRSPWRRCSRRAAPESGPQAACLMTPESG